MEKKIECEVVQDLLLNYVDDVLNPESKKLVEKHLAECEICQNKLKEIRADIKENEDNEKKQIDYLKKIRRKNKIKSVMMTFGIILLIAFIMYLRNFIILNNMLNKAKKSLSSNNIYIESITSNTNNQTFLVKQYYKDGKYKRVEGEISDDGYKVTSIEYSTVNSDKRITVLEEPKRVNIDKGEFAKVLNMEENIKELPLFVRDDRIIIRIVLPAIYKFNIKKYNELSMYYNYNHGKKYYDIENKSTLIWIDKETGLPLKERNGNSASRFYDSEIIKEVKENIVEYRYEFDTVTDEDVAVPDFSEYEVVNCSSD